MHLVKFASPTQKNSLKSTCPTPGRTQNCRREVYFTGLALGEFCVASADVRVWRSIRKTRQTQFKMAALERRQRALALVMIYEAGFFDLQDETTIPKKKKRSVWVKPFLLRRLDPTCATMFTIQHEISCGECQREKSSAYVCETKIEQSLKIFFIY